MRDSGNNETNSLQQPIENECPNSDISSRRKFLSKSIKRAAYIAPIIWSISARTALAVTGLTDGPSPPE